MAPHNSGVVYPLIGSKGGAQRFVLSPWVPSPSIVRSTRNRPGTDRESPLTSRSPRLPCPGRHLSSVWGERGPEETWGWGWGWDLNDPSHFPPGPVPG